MRRHPLTWLVVFFSHSVLVSHVTFAIARHHGQKKKEEDGYAREHIVKVEMEIHKIFDSVLALVVRISERVVEQIVDVLVRRPSLKGIKERLPSSIPFFLVFSQSLSPRDSMV